MAIPVIDFSRTEGEDRAKTLAQIAICCQEWGFFQLINHGIPEELLEKVKKVTSECYKVEREENFKSSSTPMKMLNELLEKKSDERVEDVDWEDVFLLSDDNHDEWPTKTSGFSFNPLELRYCSSGCTRANLQLEFFQQQDTRSFQPTQLDHTRVDHSSSSKGVTTRPLDCCTRPNSKNQQLDQTHSANPNSTNSSSSMYQIYSNSINPNHSSSIKPNYTNPPKPLTNKLDEDSRQIPNKKLAVKVMEMMDENLGLPKGYINCAFNGGGEDAAFFRTKVSHYPPCPHPEKVNGLQAHTDAGGVILLYQDDVEGGLQILKDRMWIDVQPHKNAIVINTGDQIEVLSNGRYKSVWHRVLAKPEGNRRSIASFYNPSLKATIEPAVEKVEKEKQENKYPKFVFGDYMSVYAE